MADTHQRTLRLFLVRHGETADNVAMRYLGSRDVPLNEKGTWQAQRVAEALSEIPLRLIVSSPLRRAMLTAAAIQQASAVRLREDARLAEGSFGSWEGLTRDEVLKLGPLDADRLARWESDPFCAPPGGESIADLQRRVLGLVEELACEFSDASVALVSHVGPIKALLAGVLDIPLQATRRMFLDPGTVSVVEWGGHAVLRLFNSHAHLGWKSARWME